jgi:hypothetical protein
LWVFTILHFIITSISKIFIWNIFWNVRHFCSSQWYQR